MFFQKFPSITNSYMDKTIGIIRDMGKADDEWVATVKVHGGNFSMFSDGIVVKSASKNGFTEQSFYGHEGVLNKYRDRVLEVFDIIQNLQSNKVKQISIYGELMGGYYNHPDVPRNPQATKIQKGISYTPDNDFYMFAVSIDGKWMEFDVVGGLSMILGCPSAYEVCRGTMDECLSFSNEFPDPIHKFYGLPEIEDNVTEGLIVQPVVPFKLPNGDAAILKNKNEKWLEKARKPKRERVQKVIPQVVLDQADVICEYITENRLMNVLSHHGLIQKEDFGKILGMLSKDVYEDFYKENNESFDRLEKRDQRMVKKMAQKECVKLFQPYYNKHAEA